MTYIDKLFEQNFLEYASYVIKERAIPHVDDGLKPVQRRIIHSLFEMDDGKFNKVANVVGHCMKYHPHGDASIYSALVVLANKDLFIEKQGNFGNVFTGDPPSAARYIECRLLPLAKEVLYNPEITEYTDSYDGRNKEPVVFPAKIPVVLIQGAEGIAVGMSTKILPHNFIEVLEAMVASLEGEQLLLFPDFITGGLADVSEYNDGNGKILVRAKLDTKDPKKIIIKEIPYGTTTESLIASIENAAKKNKIKIASIADYSSENVEIEIKLARGVHSKETVDALYAFTDCEISISVNLLLIDSNNKPKQFTVSGLIDYYAQRLKSILKQELELEKNKLLDRMHIRTLERIFVEERIYKKIEKAKTSKSVIDNVIKGFEPFKKEILRDITKDDVDHLLKIPIRRISLYDIEKNKKEIQEIEASLKEVNKNLKNLTAYAIGFLNRLIVKYEDKYKRKTEIISFEKTDVRDAAQRNLKLKYDIKTGYLGYNVNGKSLFDVSVYDRILVIKSNGTYFVTNVPEKMFVDKNMLYCMLADSKLMNDKIFTLIYSTPNNKYTYVKRFKIKKYILNKSYELIPDGGKVLNFTDKENCKIIIDYKPKPRLKVLTEEFNISDFLVKGVKAIGVRLSTKEVKKVKIV